MRHNNKREREKIEWREGRGGGVGGVGRRKIWRLSGTRAV